MRKWIFGVLLVANVLFFTAMHWGGMLTADAVLPRASAELNADKMKLLNMAAVSAAVSAVPPEAPVMASSVLAVSAAAPDAAPTPALVSHAAVPPPPLKPNSVKLSCMEWGEFSGPDLSRASKALDGLSLGSRLKQRVSEHTSGYWVYIAPVKTHAQVERKVSQLKTLGIADYFVIQESGAWQNAISLGVFKTEDAAKKYLLRLRESGVKSATLGERASKLKFTVFVLNSLEGALASQVAVLHKEFPDSELKLVPCN